ncbi:MAG: 30S ribosome-binding factor RbfA [Bacteroidales bacterium]|jgi:ribosome-binding factor A|nr:30S ribosome-binding factor RbfA [Bacteroidales bacterium]
METTRQQKISRLVQRELGEIFQKETYTMFDGALITPTIVRIAPDLSVAKVYVSIFALKRGRGEIFEIIQANVKKIRQMLAGRTGKQLRIVPELAFFIDDSLDYQENIEKILSQK